MKGAKGLGWAVLVAVAAGIGACSATIVDHTNSGSAGGSGGSGGSRPTPDGSGAGDPCFPDSCSGPSSTGAGGGAVCGGLAGMACGDGLYCAFANGSCGGDDTEGTCKPKPAACDKHVEPVCGCDGQLYDNPCDATAAGTDTSSSKSCMFACGSAICAHGSQYCQITTDEGLPDSYDCSPVPTACNGEPSCACISCSSCEESASGDVTVKCEGEF